MECNVLTAIIGVFGTLAGIILGFILNRIIKTGKLKFYINDMKIVFSVPDGYGGANETEAVTETSKSATIIIDFDIYNQSSDYKIMREICFSLEHEGKSRTFEMMDLATRRTPSQITFIDRLVVLTVPPKSLLKYSTESIITDDLYKVKGSKKFIQYRDHKNKLKTINIK